MKLQIIIDALFQVKEQSQQNVPTGIYVLISTSSYWVKL